MEIYKMVTASPDYQEMGTTRHGNYSVIPLPPPRPPVISVSTILSINRYIDRVDNIQIHVRFINSVILNECGMRHNSLVMYIMIKCFIIGKLQSFEDWENITNAIHKDYSFIEKNVINTIVYRVWTGYTGENEMLSANIPRYI